MERNEKIEVENNVNLNPSETPIKVDFGYRVHYLSLEQAKELQNKLNDALK